MKENEEKREKSERSEETLLISEIIQENLKHLSISSYKNLNNLTVINPLVITEQFWYNISSEIGNNKFILEYGGNQETVTLEDGWYSNEQAMRTILTLIVQGFNVIGVDLIFDIESFTKKIILSSFTPGTKKIIFPPGNLESSKTLLGFDNNISFDVTIKSPKQYDLFSNGRFNNIKIKLDQFSSSSYINEPQTLIYVPGVELYGGYIKSSDPLFLKQLFYKTKPLSLSIKVTDGKNNIIKISKPIYLSFQIASAS